MHSVHLKAGARESIGTRGLYTPPFFLADKSTTKLSYIRHVESYSLFVCFKGGGVHLSFEIESVFSEFPMGPALPP